MKLPKVLIINQPFNNNTGGGITLSNLFRGWDKDKIAVLCQSYLLKNVDQSICNNYYQLGQKEHQFVFPFNILKRRHYSGPVIFDNEKEKYPAKPKSKFRTKLILDYFNPLLKYWGIFNEISETKLSVELVQWLTDFNPDIIYAVATSRDALKFISLVRLQLKKPLVFHMMDDWIISDAGLFKSREHKKNELEFKKLLDEADVLLSISDEMASEYKSRYGKNSVTFHNPIDLQFWKQHQRTSYELNRSPAILYAGRIGLGIYASLELIAKAIEKINKDQKLSLRFVLQSQERPAWSSTYECIEYTNFVPYDELPKVFADADFLILPYDFSLQSQKYIGYSMPTKATEYMISGTPIIIFAPEGTALVKYATKYQWAKVITQNDINKLCEGITILVENKAEREKLGQKAIKVAVERHASTKIISQFREILSSLNQNNK